MFIRYRIGFVLFLLSTLGLAAGPAGGQSKNGRQLLNEVLAALEARDKQMNPVHFIYSTDILWKKAWVSVLHPKLKNPADTRFSNSIVYARSGVKTYMRRVSTNPLSPESGREDFRLYNGEVTLYTSNQPNNIMMTRKNNEIFLGETPMQIVGEFSLLQSLRQWAKEESAFSPITVSEKNDPATGKLLIDFSYQSKAAAGIKRKCTIQPDLGYAVRRCETFDNRSGSLINSYRCDNYDMIDGMAFPRTGVHEQYLGKNELGFSVTLQLKSVETNAREIPESLFEYDTPEGMTLWDEDNQVFVRRSKQIQSHLDEIIRQVGPKTGLWQQWYVWGGVATAVVAVAWFIRRRLRSRSAAGAVST